MPSPESKKEAPGPTLSQRSMFRLAGVESVLEASELWRSYDQKWPKTIKDLTRFCACMGLELHKAWTDFEATNEARLKALRQLEEMTSHRDRLYKDTQRLKGHITEQSSRAERNWQLYEKERDKKEWSDDVAFDLGVAVGYAQRVNEGRTVIGEAGEPVPLRGPQLKTR